MKKYIKSIFIIIILLVGTLVLQNCQKEEKFLSDIDTEQIELRKLVMLTKATNRVSENLLNMGVSSIDVKHENGVITYKPKSKKFFYLNKQKINLSSYTFILANNTLSIKDNDELKLTIIDNKPYIYSKDYNGIVNDDMFYLNNTFNLLLLFLNEITSPLIDKIDSNAYMNKIEAGCGYWNTYYVYGTGGNLSVAQANLAGEIDYYTSGSLSGCSPIGSSNSLCFAGELGCIATQAFCC